MAQSLVKIYLHIIFSTKNRENTLPTSLLGEIHSYMAGAIKNCGCMPILVGGTSNHVHILCELTNNMSVSELIRQIKTSSSKWIKGKSEQRGDFAWQGGYAVFSVSQSNVDAVTSYIANQEQHHHKRTFEEELLGFLSKYKIEYDERHIWTT